MFPLRDSIPSRTVPVVNYAVIALCGLVFLAQSMEPPDGPSLVEKYGMIPARVRNPRAEIEIPDIQRQQLPDGRIIEKIIHRPAAPSPIPPILTLFTCIFLHGGLMHFVGNMWFLFIFGDNVEDRFGHVGYALFYTVCGVGASVVHFLSGPGSPVPTIGASGASAGVMGAYFVWYPRAHVQALLPIGMIMQIIVVPAPLFLGLWFLMQAMQGAASSPEAAGVAWWAHIGGFVVGAGLAWVLGKTPLTRPPVREELPGTDHSHIYRMPRR